MDKSLSYKYTSSQITILKQRDDGNKKQVVEKAKGLLQV